MSPTPSPADLAVVALQEAVRFHKGAKSDDPETVIETAREFYAFLSLTGITEFEPKHVNPGSGS